MSSNMLLFIKGRDHIRLSLTSRIVIFMENEKFVFVAGIPSLDL
jgi:hypothetical protein